MGVAVRSSERDIRRHAITEQLERMLAHSLFRNSRRYPTLFREMVERTLDGRTGDLKERTLGVDVFGRDPAYDTGTDPIVRITAGEIRKRLAQYYQEPGHEEEIRIGLPSGSYVPEFQMPVEQEPVTAAPAPRTASTPGRWSRTVPLAYVVGAAAVLVLILAASQTPWLAHRTALDRFWAPVVDAPGPVLLCVGQTPLPGSTTPSPRPESVTLTDTVTIAKVASLLGAKGKDSRLRGEALTSFTDLRSGPAVLIGGFNNEWTVRLMGQMRFYLDTEGRFFVIRDRQNPSKNDWALDHFAPAETLQKDYALISRLLDPTTDRMTLVAAGIQKYGTLAAGEFLTDPQYLEAFAAQAPANWYRKNIQIVISTNVIEGNSGPPRVIATHIW